MPETPLDLGLEPSLEAAGMNRLQAFIRQRITDLELSDAAVARRAGMSRQNLSDLLLQDRARIPDTDVLDSLSTALRLPRLVLRQVAAEAYGYVVTGGDPTSSTVAASLEELPEDRRRDVERLIEMYRQEAEQREAERRRGRPGDRG